MLTFIILDDDEQYLEVLKKYILDLHLDYPFEIITYACEKKFINEKNTFPKQSIFILDLVLKETKGTKLARKVHELYPNSAIIFITAFLEELTEIVDYPYCYFIYKPELSMRLEKAIQTAISYCERQALQIELKNKTAIISIQDLMYIEHGYRISRLHTTSAIYKEYENISFYLNKLPSNFIQCHKSFIVNLDFVQEYHREQFILKNGEEIQISRTFSKNARSAFFEYIKNRA